MLGQAAADFDVEFQLLLACSTLPADEILVRSLAAQVQDWEKFLRYAESHELTSLVGHTLMSDSTCSLPSAASEYLVRNSREAAQQNLLLTAEVLRIVRALLAQNIRAIPYKGPILASSAYGNLAIRDSCDLDLLLPEKDVRRALRIMPELGYRAEYSLTPVQEARYLHGTCEYNFVHESNRTQVEIHWQVVPARLGLAFDFDRLWSRARFLAIGSFQLRVLSPEDALLVLSVHGFKHLWSCLKWVCDIANLLASPEELDWTYIVNEASRMGAMRVLLVALSLANQMCQARAPDSIQPRLGRDPVAASIAREIIGSYSSEGSMSRIKARLLTLKAYSGFRDRATYLARNLFDPATEEAVRTPERSMSVMRTHRVFHVARQAISDFCKSPRN